MKLKKIVFIIFQLIILNANATDFDCTILGKNSGNGFVFERVSFRSEDYAGHADWRIFGKDVDMEWDRHYFFVDVFDFNYSSPHGIDNDCPGARERQEFAVSVTGGFMDSNIKFQRYRRQFTDVKCGFDSVSISKIDSTNMYNVTCKRTNYVMVEKVVEELANPKLGDPPKIPSDEQINQNAIEETPWYYPSALWDSFWGSSKSE